MKPILDDSELWVSAVTGQEHAIPYDDHDPFVHFNQVGLYMPSDYGEALVSVMCEQVLYLVTHTFFRKLIIELDIIWTAHGRLSDEIANESFMYRRGDDI